MELTQIATLMNDVLYPNQIGDEAQGSGMIAEDLRNVVDLGTPIQSMTGHEFEDFAQKIAVGVLRTYFDGRRIGVNSFGLEMDGQEFGGVIQRLRNQLYKMNESHALNPTSVYDDASAPSYIDGRFYGLPGLDSRLYTKTVTGKIVHSISEAKTKKMFTTRQGVIDFFAQIEVTVANTVDNDMQQLAKALIRKFILQRNASGQRLNLIPLYNTAHNLTSTDPGYIDLTNWDQSETFKLFCQKVIIRLKRAMSELGVKYGDGNIPTFTPPEDMRVLLLDDFATDIDFAQSSVYHKELTDIGEYRTISALQNPSDDMIEFISATSFMDKILEVETDPTDSSKSVETPVSYVVGAIYDKYAMGIVQTLQETGVEPVGAALFTNYHQHIARQYWLDNRNNGIILCLDAEPTP